MKPSLQCFSLVLSLSLLASCNGLGVKLNGDIEDEINATSLQDLLKKVGLNEATINEHMEMRKGSLLLKATYFGWLTVAHKLLLQGVHADAKKYTRYGNTPLHLAIEKSYLSMVQMLLYYRATVNCKNNDGNTPLHLAARNGLTKIAQLLLERSADLNIQNNKGHKPFDLANSKFPPPKKHFF